MNEKPTVGEVVDALNSCGADSIAALFDGIERDRTLTAFPTAHSLLLIGSPPGRDATA